MPLKSLDIERTHAMLGKIGKRISSTEYDVEGESLYFENGCCDCPWSAYEFARSLCEVEGCYALENFWKPVYPTSATVPLALVRVSRTDADRCLAEGDLKCLRMAALQ
ncbi:MAG TPA: hypothetical protein VHB77_13960, partial [Planctomycetaceae bacterium]|nr:hypothetical protein [Planctomycetaceae bacterium]